MKSFEACNKKSIVTTLAICIIVVMSSIAMISCSSEDIEKDEAKKTKESTVEQIADSEATGEEKSSQAEKNQEDKVKENKEANSSAKSSTPKKEGTASKSGSNKAETTAASTEAVKVCYISIEGYCSSKSISLQGGDTAYSILTRSGATVSGSSSYVRGINGLFEFDQGPESGWMYSVNGYSPNVGAGSYSVGEGDSISWYYVTEY